MKESASSVMPQHGWRFFLIYMETGQGFSADQFPIGNNRIRSGSYLITAVLYPV